MRESECIAQYARSAFAAEPLSAEETKRGCAARIVSCIASLENAMTTWIVLYADASKSTADIAIRLCGPAKLLGSIEGSEVLEQGVPCSIAEGSPEWFVRECHVTLPYSMRFFTLKFNDAKTSVSWSRRNELVDQYADKVQHAAWDPSYPEWLEMHRSQRDMTPRSGELLMSIVTPAYRTPPALLRAMLDSVVGQLYSHWELIVVNASPDQDDMKQVFAEYQDERITVIDHPQNEGIAGNTNIGITHTRGDYVSFLDHDDVLEPDALLRYVEAIETSATPVDLLYCDEDSIDENDRYLQPLFKPGFNHDLLLSNNYAIHWLTVSRYVLDNTVRSTAVVDGAQDYDLTFKAAEIARSIVHLPIVLYHWRIHSGSINSNPDSKPYAQTAGQIAIEEHCGRIGLDVNVSQEDVICTYRTDFIAPVSFWARYEDVLGRVDSFMSFARQCDADYILVCRPDLILDSEGVQTLISYFVREEVRAVAPCQMADESIYDGAGAIVCPDGSLVRMNHLVVSAGQGGYVGRAKRPYDAAVLDPDCMMVRRDDVLANGLDERFMTLRAALADYCLRANEQGNLCVYVPYAVAHRAGTSSFLGGARISLDEQDALRLRDQHDSIVHGDPRHNPNFDPWSAYYKLNKGQDSA